MNCSGENNIMQINGDYVTETECINDAQFWIPLNNPHNLDITVGKLYRLYTDKYEDEDFIMDDSGTLNMAYTICNGTFYSMF